MYISIDTKIIQRKRNFVVYIKEDQIVDLLNVMEAHVALMDLENADLKEMRNRLIAGKL